IIVASSDLVTKDPVTAIRYIKFIAKQRLFMLELADKFGWNIAIAYCELFSHTIKMVPSYLKQALEYSDMMQAIKLQQQKKKSNQYAAAGNFMQQQQQQRRSNPKTQLQQQQQTPTKTTPPWVATTSSQRYANCYRCGGTGHWTASCSTKKGGEDNSKRGGE